MPHEWLADGGFAKHGHIELLEAQATQVFAPVVAPKDKQRDRYAPLPGDSQALGQWRQRMGTDAAKLTYKERAASIECTNAHLRNRGLLRFNVRGLASRVRHQPPDFQCRAVPDLHPAPVTAYRQLDCGLHGACTARQLGAGYAFRQPIFPLSDEAANLVFW